jgi:hypothetical protein
MNAWTHIHIQVGRGLHVFLSTTKIGSAIKRACGCDQLSTVQKNNNSHTHTHTIHTAATIVLALFKTRDSSTWDYETCHRAHVHTWQVYSILIIHCISYTVIHTNETEFTQQVDVMNRYFRLHRMKCVRWCVFVLVFHRTKHGNIVLEQGLREIFHLKTEVVAGGWTKFHSGELHDWYWLVNIGGWCSIQGFVAAHWPPLHAPLDHMQTFLQVCFVFPQYWERRVLSVRKRRQESVADLSITGFGASETGGFFRHQPIRTLPNNEGLLRN